MIDDILAGKAINLALKGAGDALRAFRGQRDSLGRLLVLLHVDFGDACDLGRDVFYAWRTHEALVAVFNRVLTGELLTELEAVEQLADVIEPRLVRTEPDKRHELAEQMARAAWRAAPIVVEGGGEGTRLLLSHIRAARRDDDRASSSPRCLRFGIPLPAARFTGRQAELAELHHLLGSADRAVVTQAISGLGGVGKSQLAAQYVHEHLDDYDVVAWIRAEDGGVVDLARLAAKLGEPVGGLSPSEAAQLALDWLNRSEQRWLLVLDNVESPKQLDGLLPRSGGGRVLVTSRDRTLRQFAPVLSVDVFDQDTATSYLVDRAGRPGDSVAASELAKALGCLPLALSHAGAYCENGTSFADYLALLGELPAGALFDSHPELSYAQTVALTWKASIHAASADAPLAAPVLEMAAHLGADAIPKSLFEVLIDAPTAIERKGLTEALNALARFSLATVNDDSVSVHRLLQKTVRDDAAARGDKTAALHALVALSDIFPGDVRAVNLWPIYERLLPHVLSLAAVLRQPGEAGPALIELLNLACQYLNFAAPGHRGLITAQIALQHAENILGVKHAKTIVSRTNLAFAFRAVGRTNDAITILEPLLADCELIIGGDHLHTFNVRHNLAFAYLTVGRVDEAITIFEALDADGARVLGAEHPRALTGRHNLALAYLGNRRVDDAIAILQPLYVDSQRLLGAEHPDTLAVHQNLAYAYYDAGRVDEAIAIFEPLLADSERIMGAEHPHTLDAHQHLARAYQAIGRIGEAIAMLQRVLADRSRILGSDHPDTLRIRHYLARAYGDAGRRGDAITISRALLADSARILGVKHSDTLATCAYLARSYLAEGRIDETVVMLEELLSDHDRINEREDSETLVTSRNFAARCQADGRVDEASAILERLLANGTPIVGTEHPDNLATRNNLVLAYQLLRPNA